MSETSQFTPGMVFEQISHSFLLGSGNGLNAVCFLIPHRFVDKKNKKKITGETIRLSPVGR